MKYSIIVPVYNRPEEVRELLESLTQQTYKNFEVIIVEDGSSHKCEDIVASFADRLEVHYYFKKNGGQGFARNYGYERATGDYFIVFDSDCLIPEKYLEIVNNRLSENYLDAYGGPDKAATSFTKIQKAISYAMTSPMSTGGIRGNKKQLGGKFHPRSFNMGISREVYEKTKGYILPKMGEDIEFSIRIIKNGFKVGLIPEAHVYHKRRTNFRQFYKQLHFFGRARININRFHKGQIKAVHFFPAIFALGVFSLPLTFIIHLSLFLVHISGLALYSLLAFSDAVAKEKNAKIGMLSVIAVWTQLLAYGIGFITEVFSKPPKTNSPQHSVDSP